MRRRRARRAAATYRREVAAARSGTALQRRRARALLDLSPGTYAAECGIRLKDTPAPLYQLVVMAGLMAKPISTELAAAGVRALFEAGYRTPARMRAATWQERVDALGRGHYRRYDESTATLLDRAAELMTERWRGDLRRLAVAADHDATRCSELLQELPGIGAVAASIVLREAQHVWTWLRPYSGDRVAGAARELGLPTTAAGLAALAGTDDLAALTAALIRSTHDDDLRASVADA